MNVFFPSVEMCSPRLLTEVFKNCKLDKLALCTSAAKCLLKETVLVVHCSSEEEATRSSSGLKYCKDLKWVVHAHALLHLLHAGPVQHAPHQVVLYLFISLSYLTGRMGMWTGELEHGTMTLAFGKDSKSGRMPQVASGFKGYCQGFGL